MDVYTKEYLDDKFQTLEEDLQVIKTKLGITDEFNFDDEPTEDKTKEEEKENFTL